jgi:hypothetical protein
MANWQSTTAARKTKQRSIRSCRGGDTPFCRDRRDARLVGQGADELMGCTENSPEEAELAALTDVIEAYEAQRWPLGKIPGGKG